MDQLGDIHATSLFGPNLSFDASDESDANLNLIRQEILDSIISLPEALSPIGSPRRAASERSDQLHHPVVNAPRSSAVTSGTSLQSPDDAPKKSTRKRKTDTKEEKENKAAIEHSQQQQSSYDSDSTIQPPVEQKKTSRSRKPATNTKKADCIVDNPGTIESQPTKARKPRERKNKSSADATQMMEQTQAGTSPSGSSTPASTNLPSGTGKTGNGCGEVQPQQTKAVARPTPRRSTGFPSSMLPTVSTMVGSGPRPLAGNVPHSSVDIDKTSKQQQQEFRDRSSSVIAAIEPLSQNIIPKLSAPSAAMAAPVAIPSSGSVTESQVGSGAAAAAVPPATGPVPATASKKKQRKKKKKNGENGANQSLSSSGLRSTSSGQLAQPKSQAPQADQLQWLANALLANIVGNPAFLSLGTAGVPQYVQPSFGPYGPCDASGCLMLPHQHPSYFGQNPMTESAGTTVGYNVPPALIQQQQLQQQQQMYFQQPHPYLQQQYMHPQLLQQNLLMQQQQQQQYQWGQSMMPQLQNIADCPSSSSVRSLSSAVSDNHVSVSSTWTLGDRARMTPRLQRPQQQQQQQPNLTAVGYPSGFQQFAGQSYSGCPLMSSPTTSSIVSEIVLPSSYTVKNEPMDYKAWSSSSRELSPFCFNPTSNLPSLLEQNRLNAGMHLALPVNPSTRPSSSAGSRSQGYEMACDGRETSDDGTPENPADDPMHGVSHSQTSSSIESASSSSRQSVASAISLTPLDLSTKDDKPLQADLSGSGSGKEIALNQPVVEETSAECEPDAADLDGPKQAAAFTSPTIGGPMSQLELYSKMVRNFRQLTDVPASEQQLSLIPVVQQLAASIEYGMLLEEKGTTGEILSLIYNESVRFVKYMRTFLRVHSTNELLHRTVSVLLLQLMSTLCFLCYEANRAKAVLAKELLDSYKACVAGANSYLSTQPGYSPQMAGDALWEADQSHQTTPADSDRNASAAAYSPSCPAIGTDPQESRNGSDGGSGVSQEEIFKAKELCLEQASLMESHAEYWREAMAFIESDKELEVLFNKVGEPFKSLKVFHRPADISGYIQLVLQVATEMASSSMATTSGVSHS